ncbi:MAG: DUF6142 family protein [Lachnospiraceae bacterium]|nr:DUF6142 family protein [Lachnospiraceae bacterium]
MSSRFNLSKKYKFTDKKIDNLSIMGIVLGSISLLALIAAIIISFFNDGQAFIRFGLTVILALIFSIVGEVLSIISRLQPDNYYILSDTGIVINTINLFFIMYIVGLGIMNY